MHVKNSWKDQIRGWVPKDMNLPTRQQTAPPKANGYKLKIGVSIFVTLAIVWGIQGALSPAYAPERSWCLYFTATAVIIGVSFIVLLVGIKQTRTLRGLKGELNSERQLRGWIPKEATLSIPQTTRMSHLNQRIKALPTRIIGTIATASVVLSILLLLFPYYLFPEAYVSKANPVWGYASPNTLAAWTALGIGLGLLVFSILAFTWLGLKLKLEGSKWAQWTWVTPRIRTLREEKAFKIAGIANAIILATLLGLYALTSRSLWTTNITIAAWAIFSVTIAVVNLSIYLHSQRR